VRKIAAALDRLDPDRARYIAAFAYILSRVARADLQISDVELREMERLVQEHGGLPEEQAVLVVQMAKTQSTLFGGVENFLVTREFDKIATREQKIAPGITFGGPRRMRRSSAEDDDPRDRRRAAISFAAR
jgi:hypothetical protein